MYVLMWLFINQLTAGLHPEMQNWSHKQVSCAKLATVLSILWFLRASSTCWAMYLYCTCLYHVYTIIRISLRFLEGLKSHLLSQERSISSWLLCNLPSSWLWPLLRRAEWWIQDLSSTPYRPFLKFKVKRSSSIWLPFSRNELFIYNTSNYVVSVGCNDPRPMKKKDHRDCWALEPSPWKTSKRKS